MANDTITAALIDSVASCQLGWAKKCAPNFKAKRPARNKSITDDRRASESSGVTLPHGQKRKKPDEILRTALKPIGHADQNPPPPSFGKKPRRRISALAGLGGQATDQPIIQALARALSVIISSGLILR
jgi:hypothetical protein